MKIFIVGHKGNMGSRYKAIVKFFGHEWAGDDLDGWTGGFTSKNADRIIIATPTSEHLNDIRKYRDGGKPILCEKPITTDIDDIELLEDLIGLEQPFEMIDQYRHIISNIANGGVTLYDYFKHGADGLYYDCINVIKHAKNGIILRAVSPFWQCVINGQQLSISDMDHAYMQMISEWLLSPKNDVRAIIAAHFKVHTLKESQCLA